MAPTVFIKHHSSSALQAHDLYGFTTNPAELTDEQRERFDDWETLKGELAHMDKIIRKEDPSTTDSFIRNVFVEFNKTNAINATGMTKIDGAINTWRSDTGTKITNYIAEESALAVAQAVAGAALIASAVWSWCPGVNLAVEAAAIIAVAAATGIQYAVDKYENTIVDYIHNGNKHITEQNGLEDINIWQAAFSTNSINIATFGFTNVNTTRSMLYSTLSHMFNATVPMTNEDFKQTVATQSYALAVNDPEVTKFMCLLAQFNNSTDPGKFEAAAQEIVGLIPRQYQTMISSMFAGFAAMSAFSEARLGYSIYKSIASAFKAGYSLLPAEEGEVVATSVDDAFVAQFAASRSTAVRGMGALAGVAIIGLAIFQEVEAILIEEKLKKHADDMKDSLHKYYNDVVTAARTGVAS